MKTVDTLQNLKALLSEHIQGTVVRTTYRDATPGVGLGELFPHYAIATVHESREFDLLRESTPIISLEKLRGTSIDRTHEGVGEDLLSMPEIIGAIEKMPGPNYYVLPYRIWQETFEKLDKTKWQVCAVHPQFRDELDSRETFRSLAEEAGIRLPTSLFIEECSVEAVKEFFYANGPTVVQEPEEVAGVGTRCFHSEQEIESLEDIDGKSRLLSAYITGDSIACTGCVLPDQILTSPPRAQVINCKELTQSFGQFCGHDWNCGIHSDSRAEIQEQVRAVGTVLRKRGYRGIFGLDAVTDKETHEVYAIEINPRLLGSTQINTLQQMECDFPPLLGFHVLSFLDVACQTSKEVETAIANSQMDGAHLILRNIEGTTIEVEGEVEPGIYQVLNGQISFVRPAASFTDIQKKGEYLVTMVPYRGMRIGPKTQLIRIQAKTQCFDLQQLSLLPDASALVEHVRSSLKLKAV